MIKIRTSASINFTVATVHNATQEEARYWSVKGKIFVIYRLTLCSGNLEKKLDEYLGLMNSVANQEGVQRARSTLMRAVYQCIQNCGDKLSDGEVKTLKKAIDKFVQKRNQILARRVIQALDKGRWDVLRIEVSQYCLIFKCDAHNSDS